METFLIDTNILIDHLRGEPKATEFLTLVEKDKHRGFISVVTEYELLCGSTSPRAEGGH